MLCFMGAFDHNTMSEIILKLSYYSCHSTRPQHNAWTVNKINYQSNTFSYTVVSTSDIINQCDTWKEKC